MAGCQRGKYTHNLTRTTKRQKTYQRKLIIHKSGLNKLQHRKKNYTKRKIDRGWFNRLLRHRARKRSGSILTTPEHTGGKNMQEET